MFLSVSQGNCYWIEQILITPVIVQFGKFLFGKFLKIIVSVDTECGLNTRHSILTPTPNHPIPLKSVERNRKNKLYNKLVAYFENNSLYWMPDEVILWDLTL